MIAVAGALANKPGNGGEAWVRLSWVLGLRRLGIDAWLIEEAPRDISVTARSWFDSVVDRFELSHRAALVDPEGRAIAGAPADVADALASSDLLINISGNVTCERLLALPARRAYLDLDPGYTQFWAAQSALGDALARHEYFLTVGLCIGNADCTIPTDGFNWRPVLPPVILDDWPVATLPSGWRFTTVAAWRGGYGRVEHQQHVFGQKAHEFRRFADLPRRVDATLEVALDIHPGDAADIAMLTEAGWKLVDPHTATGDPDAFRDYVQGSAAEFSPAQGIYVETRSGWFSDRTARYLASGRPAVVQDTGLPAEIPVGEGLLTFRTVDEAAAAVESVSRDYDRHSRAARSIAERFLASDKVLAAVLEEVLR